MKLLLGIESSCDETAAAVFDVTNQRILSSHLFSQIKSHQKYGGVVPEIASRSHLEHIAPIVAQALASADCSLEDLSGIAVTSKPGLAGSLLVGFSFAKALAWRQNIPLIPVNHLAGHIFSSQLDASGAVRKQIAYPYLCLSASGGHSALYKVTGAGEYTEIGNTLDDAAGEAFDKISKLIGLGYPGGPIIEKYAEDAQFTDFFAYPRTKYKPGRYAFSFSGLKTAILYDLAKRGHVDLETGKRTATLNSEIQKQVASSLLVCVGDIFCAMVARILKDFPELRGVSFVGGVACNKYLKARLQATCDLHQCAFTAAPPQFCTDNAAMIALAGSFDFAHGTKASLNADIFE